jgi:hypothetical protein
VGAVTAGACQAYGDAHWRLSEPLTFLGYPYARTGRVVFSEALFKRAAQYVGTSCALLAMSNAEL